MGAPGNLPGGPTPAVCRSAPPGLPAVGDRFGDFRVVAELGRGCEGRVYLAVQSSLADRPIVLKLTRLSGQEHTVLARLQHTHIVPLYFMEEDAARDLRVLGMPYFGGAPLHRLLADLDGTPPARREGRHLLEALDRCSAGTPLAPPTAGPVRDLLARASYVQAVCWVGACLADALGYAHERGLIHLDLKPANVLIAADGQPMLLDFHLAQGPIPPGYDFDQFVGGTPMYMSPEQRAAVAAVADDRAIAAPVDARSDVYSLGLVLAEALGTLVPLADPDEPPDVRRSNPAVSTGLADVLRRCLAPDPSKRYPSAAALADDLRRHLNHRPLRGVRNRSLLERWRKWRRRRPAAPAVAVLAALAAVSQGQAQAPRVADRERRLRQAEAAHRAAADHLRRDEPAAAERSMREGLALLDGLPAAGALREGLEAQERLVGGAQLVHQLHRLAEGLRYLDGAGAAADPRLAESCRAVWRQRDRLRAEPALDHSPDLRRRVGEDLPDFGILLADLVSRPAGGTAPDHRAALEVLREAESVAGPTPALLRARQWHAAAAGDRALAEEAARRAAASPPRTAWECYAAGRALLRAGDLGPAAELLRQAVDRQPQEFWPQYLRAACAFRQGSYDEAAAGFGVCVALRPDAPECSFNRALAEERRDRDDLALADYDRTLRLDPRRGSAWLNRGVLHLRHGRPAEALCDFERALGEGADAADAHYNSALAHLKNSDPAAARSSLRQALAADPRHAAALELERKLRGTGGGNE
jgi:serine/threonine protein kinase/Tfp pilus assembly protein PilF